MKPLFIPLKTEYFNQFKSGEKTSELREYGKRWNERTCEILRPVTLSKGYGKHERLYGKIVDFRVKHGTEYGNPWKSAILDCYGTLDVQIAEIYIKLNDK